MKESPSLCSAPLSLLMLLWQWSKGIEAATGENRGVGSTGVLRGRRLDIWLSQGKGCGDRASPGWGAKREVDRGRWRLAGTESFGDREWRAAMGTIPFGGEGRVRSGCVPTRRRAAASSDGGHDNLQHCLWRAPIDLLPGRGWVWTKGLWVLQYFILIQFIGSINPCFFEGLFIPWA